MTGRSPDRRAETEAAAAARRQREAEALRANLARRKAQLRERAGDRPATPGRPDGDDRCR